MAKNREQPCRKCGRRMIFAEGPNGAIPMDARAVTVYHVREGEDGEPVASKVELEEKVYISHFATCPNAAEFSRGRG